jgi:hypothetical protein
MFTTYYTKQSRVPEKLPIKKGLKMKVSDQKLITQKLDTIIDTSYELRGIIKND